MRDDPLLRRLDALANRTPFPRLAAEGGNQRPRPRRILPALFLAAAAFGMAAQVRRPDWLAIDPASIVLLLGFVPAILLQLAGPFRHATPPAPFDEREAAERQRAANRGLAAVAVLAVAGAFAASLRRFWPGIWQPATPDDWRTITFFLVAVWLNVAMLAASWRMPRAATDDE